MSGEQFGLGVKTSIYNNELRKRREGKGLKQSELGELVGLSGGAISNFETFRSYPAKGAASKIAKVLGARVDVLFPAWLEEYKLRNSSFDQEIKVDMLTLDSPEVLALEAKNDIEDEVERSLLNSKITEAMSCLTPREQKILRMRFGLEDGRGHTLEEVGREFGVSRDRIRQIEAKALAKLRKSKNREGLLSFFDDEVINRVHQEDVKRRETKW